MNEDLNWLKKEMFLRKATTFPKNISFYIRMGCPPIPQYKAPES